MYQQIKCVFLELIECHWRNPVEAWSLRDARTPSKIDEVHPYRKWPYRSSACVGGLPPGLAAAGDAAARRDMPRVHHGSAALHIRGFPLRVCWTFISAFQSRSQDITRWEGGREGVEREWGKTGSKKIAGAASGIIRREALSAIGRKRARDVPETGFSPEDAGTMHRESSEEVELDEGVD